MPVHEQFLGHQKAITASALLLHLHLGEEVLQQCQPWVPDAEKNFKLAASKCSARGTPSFKSNITI